MTLPDRPVSLVPLPASPPAADRPTPPEPSGASGSELSTPRRQWLIGKLDNALVGVVLLFAFLVSSFAIRNSDFWLHLATGRLLANGRYRFGEDPFAYTTAGVYWTNHAWLFDLILYALYQKGGGASVVVIKALLVVALAWFMLRIRRANTGLWLPATCIALALLTMSSRLLLQPITASCFFLSLALWLLWWPHAPGGSSTRARLWLLLGVFIAWVNVDSWFLLGPLLVILFWLGERLSGGSHHTPIWLVPAGLGACLINPHHFHVWTTLPAELTPAVWASSLPNDPRFRPLFLSPWQLGNYLVPAIGLNAAGLAYFVLTALGLASFVLSRTGLRDWRLLVWVGFALLAACQLRTVPFFAVVAGPITTLNLQDWLARRRTVPVSGDVRAGAAGSVSLWAVGGRVALLLGELALIVLTWPGWLQAVPYERRRVAWAEEPDPSLQRIGQTLSQWRREGQLAADERVFATHPDVAHYCAWFSPGEKCFLDHRFPLFGSVAKDYEEVCRAVALIPGEETNRWRGVLRDHGVSVLLLHDVDPQRLSAALHRLASRSGDWTLLRVDGWAVAFGWRRSVGTAAARLRFDAECVVYGPEGVLGVLPQALAEGSVRSPRLSPWWERFVQPAPSPTWESGAAFVYLRFFEDQAARERQAQLPRLLGCYAAGLAGVPALASGPWTDTTSVLLRLLQAEPFLPGLNDRSPELPLLAVRAARRALVVNPDDASAWFCLGQAYLFLHRLTGELSHDYHWQPLEVLRHVQAVTALEHALILDPDIELAHRALAGLYAEMTYLDLALEHRQEALRLARRSVPTGEEADAVTSRLDQESKQIGALEQLVQHRRNEYLVRSRPLTGDPLARARLAIRMGLARVALDDVLLRSPAQLLGGEGARLELELLLMLGRAEEVRDKLDDEELRQYKSKMGVADLVAPPLPGYQGTYRLASYEWLRFYQAAATGDYDLADSALHQVMLPLEEQERLDLPRLRQSVPTTLASELGLSAMPEPLLLRLFAHWGSEQMTHFLTDTIFRALERGDLNTLGGLLALERGEPTVATEYFQAAVAAGWPGPFAGQPLARAYLRRLDAAHMKFAQGNGCSGRSR